MNENPKFPGAHILEHFPIDWKRVRLSEVVVPENGIQTGPFGSLLHKEDYVAAGTPIITVEHIGENRILHTGPPCVKEDDKQRLKKFWMKPGDIVFSRVGSVDRRALVREPENGWLFSGRCLRIRPNPEAIHPEFLSWYLGLYQIKEHIRNIAVGATMPSLNTKILSNIPVILPPLPTQERIADILGSLDDKIELNRQMNQTLEAMARAIFKSWFVDFDPVYAKMEGREFPLPIEVMDLFPDELVESELGLIPRGWEAKPLDSIADYLNGLAMQKHPPIGNQESLPVLKIRELRAGTFDSSSDRADIGFSNEYIIENGDVVFSWSGSLLVKIWCGGRGGLNQHLFKVTSSCFPKWFYFLWTAHHLEEFQRIAADKATTMGHIKRNHLKQALVVVPDDQIIQEGSELIGAILEKFVNNSLQNRSLEKIRDTLLPKLMNGDVEV